MVAPQQQKNVENSYLLSCWC